MNITLKYAWLFLGVFIFFSACDKPEKEIEFRDIRNVKLDRVIGQEAYLRADAFFYNPNRSGMKLRSIDLDVALDGKQVAKINQESKIKIPALSEFSVPLEVRFNMKEAGLLNNIFSLFGGKKFDTHYKGHIKASFRGIPFKVPVDHHEALKLR